MSIHEEQGSIELGIMVHAETGERRVSISLSGGTVILMNAKQANDVIGGLQALVTDITERPFEAVGTVQ